MLETGHLLQSPASSIPHSFSPKAAIVLQKQFWLMVHVWVGTGRSTAWEMDQEMGRQTLAGQNPCMLRTLTAIPSGSAITPEHLVSAVEGQNVQVKPLLTPPPSLPCQGKTPFALPAGPYLPCSVLQSRRPSHLSI